MITLGLDLDNVKEAFLACEFPYYKNIEINENTATCTLYSVKSDHRSTIILDLSSFEKLIHQISIELIKFRSLEMVENQTAQTQADTISFHLD